MTASSPTTGAPDIYEESANSLEIEQNKRFRSCKDKTSFWTKVENQIFEEIKAARVKSQTYHPDNER